MPKMEVLVVGGGGREHALVWKIAQSPLVEKVYCAPGNGGTANEQKTINVPIGVDKFEELSRFALEKKISLVVIGPDNPLADGIVDHMEAQGLKVFGPNKAGARLESSKSHAKNVMLELGIPTARFGVFQDQSSAFQFASENEWARVVKEDGLALGKGVVVCDTIKEVDDALSKMFGANSQGSAQASSTPSGKAGSQTAVNASSQASTSTGSAPNGAVPNKNIVVVEDRLQGEELSLFLLSDGKNTLTLAACQDHKRRFDGDLGPNTGGMGAYSPVPLYEKYKEVIEKQVVKPIQAALKDGRLKYKGVLFIGILMQDDIPYVLEFNARFGDPETQALLPRLKSDIVPALIGSADGTLDSVKLDWDTRFSCCVVACSDKYPESSSKGEQIGIGDIPEDTYIFHAGTAIVNDVITTNGGRVLAVVALHDDPEQAQKRAYQALKSVSFNGIDYRKDIAWRVATKCHSR